MNADVWFNVILFLTTSIFFGLWMCNWYAGFFLFCSILVVSLIKQEF